MLTLWFKRPKPAPVPAGRAPVGALAKLASHMDIGWDFDGTLIGHAASPVLHRFIRATPRIRHILVTFRNRKRDADPWAELAAYHGAPARALFHDIVFLADDMVEGVSRIEQNPAFPWNWPNAQQRKHLEWKGRICSKRRLTALVDDNPHMVAAGCRRYGIRLFHPQDFLSPENASH